MYGNNKFVNFYINPIKIPYRTLYQIDLQKVRTRDNTDPRKIFIVNTIQGTITTSPEDIGKTIRYTG